MNELLIDDWEIEACLEDAAYVRDREVNRPRHGRLKGGARFYPAPADSKSAEHSMRPMVARVRAPRARARRSVQAHGGSRSANSGSSDSDGGSGDSDPDPDSDPPHSPPPHHPALARTESLLWDVHDLAHHLRRSVGGIYNAICARRWDLVPAPLYIGRSPRWRPEDVRAWLEQLAPRQTTPVKDAKPGRRRGRPRKPAMQVEGGAK